MAGVNRFAGKRGFVAVGDPTEFATCNGLPHSTTAGTDTTPVVTETYIAEIKVENNCLPTGFSLLNGSAAAGNVKVGLFDVNGYLIAQSASTAQSGTAALQAFAFTTAPTLKGPGVYYIGVQFDSTSARFRSHTLGISGASKKTGETYGTFTTITPPTTFTTALGPIGSLY